MGKPRRNWTVEEDALLRRVVSNGQRHPPPLPLLFSLTLPNKQTLTHIHHIIAIANSRPLLWREFAKHIPGRSNKDCRKRWWNSLADNTIKGPWSEEEDERLIEGVQKNGCNWNVVSRAVGTRNSDQCSSHWSQVLDPGINYCDWSKEEVCFPRG